ncbi:MAG: ATP-binding cassette domain-containing protein [Nitrospira sp.]|nr:ATP-binding cassette domain-containing protein [Nitrospira sp.]
MTSISCQHLGKAYGHYQVLHDVNLTLAPGECFTLLGPNGAGKITLLKILATLQRPSEGHYEMLGMNGLDRPGSLAIAFRISVPQHACVR